MDDPLLTRPCRRTARPGQTTRRVTRSLVKRRSPLRSCGQRLQWPFAVAGRRPQHGLGQLSGVRQAAVRFLGAGLFDQRRLHGPGQLGDRHRGRSKLRLRADLDPVDVQRDGRAAANAVGPVGNRVGPRPGASVRRILFAARWPRHFGFCAKSPSPPAIWPKSSAR